MPAVVAAPLTEFLLFGGGQLAGGLLVERGVRESPIARPLDRRTVRGRVVAITGWALTPPRSIDAGGIAPGLRRRDRLGSLGSLLPGVFGDRLPRRKQRSVKVGLEPCTQEFLRPGSDGDERPLAVVGGLVIGVFIEPSRTARVDLEARQPA
jgi:hypothetical protein